MDSEIDKDLGKKLDRLLKDGSLDEETEILRILEVLSEKLYALSPKEEAPISTKNNEEVKGRLNQKWGRDPFSDLE